MIMTRCALASLSKGGEISGTEDRIGLTGHSYPISTSEYPSQNHPKTWRANMKKPIRTENVTINIYHTVVIVENGFGKRLTSSNE